MNDTIKLDQIINADNTLKVVKKLLEDNRTDLEAAGLDLRLLMLDVDYAAQHINNALKAALDYLMRMGELVEADPDDTDN